MVTEIQVPERKILYTEISFKQSFLALKIMWLLLRFRENKLYYNKILKVYFIIDLMQLFKNNVNLGMYETCNL